MSMGLHHNYLTFILLIFRDNIIKAIYGLFTWMQLPDHLPVLDLPLHRATEEERIKIEFDVAVVILTSSYV